MKITGMVTVVLPLHDGALDVRRALASIAAQTYRPIEIVIVDDGSNDAGPAWVRAFRRNHAEIPVQVQTQPHAGTSAAANAGLARARGEFVAFLHQGDAWRPEKLARQVARLRGAPAAAFVLAAVEERQSEHSQCRAPARWVGVLLDGPVPLSALLARRSALEAIGGFDACGAIAPAYDLACRLAGAGQGLAMDEVLADCFRRSSEPMPLARWLATGERLLAAGRTNEAQLRWMRGRLNARHGWQALFADEPERARDCFQQAAAASPWRGSIWLGLTCARLDRWLFATGLLKPEAEGSLARVRR